MPGVSADELDNMTMEAADALKGFLYEEMEAQAKAWEKPRS